MSTLPLAPRSTRRAVYAAVVASLLLAPAARAQDSLAHPGSLLFGAGVNLQNELGTAPALQFGREWRARESRFGLRLSADYTGSSTGPRYFSYDVNTFTPTAFFTSKDRRVSLSLVTTMALTTGRIQPYVLSGIQIQERFARVTTTFGEGASLPAGVDPVTRVDERRTSDPTSGLQAGFGVQARVGSHWLYSEIRSQLSHVDAGYVSHPTPLTFGIRF